MWHCESCRQNHSDMRERCPVHGTSRPLPTLKRESPQPHCEECWRPRASIECAECGAWIHKGCKAKHDTRHQEEYMQDVECLREES